MTSAFDLQPCPWCGKKPRVRFPDEDGGGTLEHYCRKAGFEIFGLFRDDLEAIKAWNTRITDQK